MAFGDGLSEGFDWDLIRSIDWDAVASMENTVVDDSDMGTGDGSGDPVADAEREATIRSGEELLRAKLKEYGLEALEDWAFAQLREDFNVDTIVLKLPDAETSPGSGVYPFRERFAGMYTGLRGEGVINAITPFQYLQQETSMQEVAAAAGLPRGFYDDPSDFAEFIGNGVTPDEYTERVAMAATAVSNINPELKGQLQELYGIGVRKRRRTDRLLPRPRPCRVRHRTTSSAGSRRPVRSRQTGTRARLHPPVRRTPLEPERATA